MTGIYVLWALVIALAALGYDHYRRTAIGARSPPHCRHPGRPASSGRRADRQLHRGRPVRRPLTQKDNIR
jgi:hypothetical protein